jgi:hypothetical protein
VVLVSKRTLASLTATDAALGTTADCRNCNSLAEAFQIIYATDNASQLATAVAWASGYTASQLWQLQYSHLSTAEIQIRSNILVNNLLGLLQAASRGPNGYGGMGWTPAINGARQAAALTSNTQPIIDLMKEVQH